MCTATWTRLPDGGYEFLFNRDELLSRAEAEPPSLRSPSSGGEPAASARPLRWIAPTDGDFGGTWISVNEAGLTLALLNGFRPADHTPPSRVRSRGLLVADLASAAGFDELEARLEAADLDRHRSFRLLAIAPDPPARIWEWDRRSLMVDREAEARRPVISSAFEETAVGEARRREYARQVGRARDAGALPAGEPSPEILLRFHRSTEGGPSAFTVAMRRPEAASRSFTRIRVGAAEAEMSYAPGFPRENAPESALRLPLIRVPSASSRSRSPSRPATESP